MSELAVTHLTLYKHGIGFIRRKGNFTGKRLSLRFKTEEIDDILKSIHIKDFQAGAKIYGIEYDTPGNTGEEIKKTGFQVSQNAGIQAIFNGLTGKRIEVLLKDGKELKGVFAGWQYPASGSPEDELLSILDDNGSLIFFSLRNVEKVNHIETDKQKDLAYFLENINKSEKEKEILLRLSEGEHRLSISYVAPAPSWKMCYRIEIPDEVEIKQFRIYGFCIIENTLEEDLENVELSVVAGMPISFIYKLYHSHIPERMVVEEEDRTIQAPIDFEGRLEREMEPPEPKKAMYRTAGVMPPPSASPADYAIDDSFEEMDEDEVGAGLEDYSVDNYSSNISGKAKAEFFEFKFSEPVSIGRGKSSMVPLFSKEGEYKKDLIFNYSKLSDNPVFTLRFENFSGFTLESGPVTIMEGKDYSGEAIIRLSPPESEIILAYAIDTTVNILREVKTIETFDSIQLKKQYLCTNYYEVLETTYTAENKDSKDKKILIEQTRTTGMKLFDSPEPEEETLKEYRFGFSIQKKSKASLKIRERVLRERKVYLDNLDKQVAEKLYKTKKLDKSILEILKPLFTIKSDIYELEKKIQNLDKEIASAMKSQDNVRKNISTLKDSGEEGTYRKAQVKELMLGEEKIKEYEKEKESIKKEKDALLIKKQNWLNNLK